MEKMVNKLDFTLEMNVEDVGEVTEADLAAKADKRLRELTKGNQDMTGAAITVRRAAKGETPHLYEATVVVYVRPERVTVTEQKGSPTAALNGALDAIERQIRERREKLSKPWEQPGHDFMNKG